MKGLNSSSRNFLVLFLVAGLSSCELSIETAILIDDRNKFTGSFEVEEYSEGYASTFYYDIDIWKSRYPDRIIWINNFYDAGIKVYAEVNGSTFYIPTQRAGSIEIEGRGSYLGDGELSLSYTVREFGPGPDYVDFLSGLAWRYH